MAQGEAGFLPHHTDAHGVLLPAATAAPQVPPVALTSTVKHLVDLSRPAMDADWITCPSHCLEKLYGGKLVGAGKWNGFYDFRLGKLVLFVFWRCLGGVGGFHTYSIHSGIGFSGGFLGFLRVFERGWQDGCIIE
jgi:hypothetical protein